MTLVSKVDMGEVTRLTREGRLQDAMAMLRGESPDISPRENDRTSGKAGSTLDLVRRGATGPWSLGTGEDQTAPEPRAFGPFGPSRLLADALPGGMPWPAGAGGSASPVVPAGARFDSHVHRGPAGTLGYKLYVPAALGKQGAPVPLLVMLHGCTQSPDDFAVGTRMNELAEDAGYLVVYPAQSQAANAQRCWNWFQPADQQRDSGEAALIAGIVREVARAHTVDLSRVFAAGLSAGGAAAAILGQRHPDLFAAVGIHSGLACGAAGDLPSAFAAMQGRGPAGIVPGQRPIPTIVFHGDGDRTVAPVNGERVLEQATAGRGTTATVEQGRSPGGVAYTRSAHVVDGGGRPLRFERWVLHGSGHAWSGGSPLGSHTDPNGPDASREMLRFFAEVAGR